MTFSAADERDRLTDIRFASRLHREMDSQLGWEFPLWMDDDSLMAGNSFVVGNSNCQFELSQLQQAAPVDPVTPVDVVSSVDPESLIDVASPVHVVSVDREELSRLEREIIRSLQEVYRLTEQQAVSAYREELLEQQADDPSVAANHWWNYSSVLAQFENGKALCLKFGKQVEQQVQVLKMQWVSQNWTRTDFWLGLDMVGLAGQQVPVDSKAIRLTGIASKLAGLGPDKQFRSVSPQASDLAPLPEFQESADGKSDEESSVLPVIPLERPLYQEVFSQLDSERIRVVWNFLQREYSARTFEWVREQWAGVDLARINDRLWPNLDPAVEPMIQPIPTASYVGLKPAILSLQRYFSGQAVRVGELGQRMARSIPQLPPVQNGALERLVLEQFDAMRR